jgi:hypothetical protein
MDSMAKTEIKLELKSETPFLSTLDCDGQFSTFEAENKEETR